MSAFKKVFFPIGGGDDLEDRLYGACLIAKELKASLEVLKCNLKSNLGGLQCLIAADNLVSSIEKDIDKHYNVDNNDFEIIFNKVIKELDIKVSKNKIEDKANVYLKFRDGLRSELIKEESKFCDLVIVATPPAGIPTATFQTSVKESGKAVLMFPRKMKSFKTDSIIIGWNASVEASRAITMSIGLLKNAKRVQIVSSNTYINNDKSAYQLKELMEYLNYHGIIAEKKIVKDPLIPGKGILAAANEGNFDIIVAGAYGHKDFKELMFGGSAEYLLKNSKIPVFMSN